MLTKDKIQKVLDGFPNEGTIDIDELIQKIFIIEDLEKSEKDIEDGMTYTSEEMIKRVVEWKK